jgi:hypothetical protein
LRNEPAHDWQPDQPVRDTQLKRQRGSFGWVASSGRCKRLHLRVGSDRDGAHRPQKRAQPRTLFRKQDRANVVEEPPDAGGAKRTCHYSLSPATWLGRRGADSAHHLRPVVASIRILQAETGEELDCGIGPVGIAHAREVFAQLMVVLTEDAGQRPLLYDVVCEMVTVGLSIADEHAIFHQTVNDTRVRSFGELQAG